MSSTQRTHTESPVAHIPVMLEPTVAALNLRSDGHYVDGTFGRGGHSQLILKNLAEAGRLSVFDRDPQAIATAQAWAASDTRIAWFHRDFRDMQQCLPATSVDGVLLDLGVSSPQLDQAERGFSFMRDGPLDMRMDTTQGETVAEYLARVELDELTKVLREFGEEPQARKIATALVQARGSLHTTLQLANFVEQIKGRGKPGRHPATQVFQALRMAVNHELASLSAGLTAALSVMKAGARLVVISFHSLEDRVVKQFMAERAKPPASSRRDFMAPDVFQAELTIVGKKQIADATEAKANPRSRSAVLRVAEKLA
jgi:16S rRNA (cytosine1402-N4)-methyltransferase